MKLRDLLPIAIFTLLDIHHSALCSAVHIDKWNATSNTLHERTNPDTQDFEPAVVVFRQIYCIGNLPNRLRELRGAEVYTFDTPLSFCASENYGGKPGSLQAYCGAQFPIPRVVIDTPIPSFRDFNHGGRDNYRLATTFCILRCRCFPPPAGSSPAQLPSAQVLAEYQNSYDKNPSDLQLFPPSHPDFQPQYSGKLIVIFALQSSYLSIINYHSRGSNDQPPFCSDYTSIPGQPRRLIRVPPNLPSPFQSSDFATITELCAAEYFGGARIGNAGAICKSDRHSDRYKLVLSQSYAHPSFISSRDGHSTVVVQELCRRLCVCRIEDVPKHRQIRLRLEDGGNRYLNGRRGFYAAYTEDGALDMKNYDIDIDKKGLFLTPSTHQRVHSISNGLRKTCRSSDSTSCDEPWYSDIDAQDTPATIINLPVKNSPLDTLLEDSSQPKCGGSCSSASDCAGPDCKCVARPSQTQLQNAGLEPFLPALSFASTCFSMLALYHDASAARWTRDGMKRGVNGGGLGLGRRSLLGGGGESLKWGAAGELDVSCVCNQTYVSPACCLAGDDGLVWEDPARGTGMLLAEDEHEV